MEKLRTALALVLAGMLAACTTEPPPAEGVGLTGAFLASEALGSRIVYANPEEPGGDSVIEVEDILFMPDGTVTFVVMRAGSPFDTGVRTVAVDIDNVTLRPNLTITRLPVLDTARAINLSTFAPGPQADSSAYVGMLLASRYGDFNLIDANGEDLGQVDDLVIDLNTDTVTYAVVDRLGTTAATLIPWDRFEFVEGTGFVVNTDANTLGGAPAFDARSFPQPALPGWDDDQAAYWDNR
ncbi:MAG: PRC-barrel domain containing protein [Chloroflexi bacterium]|nr:PRC-barrel domain containing protein [Chloroflexota bacterium]